MLFYSCVLFLTISLSSCLPQLNNEPYTYWRNRPRSIPSNSYYSNHPATYQDPEELKRYDSQPEYRAHESRARGPEARADDVKEVRIINDPPEKVSMGETMYNDQNADFYFPGNINNHRTTNPTKKSTPTKPSVIATRSNPYVPDVSDILKNCPSTSTFCETVDSYPADYIHTVLDENRDTFRDLFGSDELIPVNISTRIGVGDGDGTPMCTARETVIQPPVAKNADDQWKYIVNDDKYVQGVRVELCKDPGVKCAMSENFPLSYETECKQKYIFRKLLSLGQTGEIETDNFRLPSCCVCVFRAKRLARAVFGLK